MLTPLEISFHGLERSEAVEDRIREKFARIEKYFDRITHARVAIEAPKRRTPLPKVFHVKIEIGIPGHNPIVVKYEPEGLEAQADITTAVRDAFAAAQRQVEHMAARMDKPAKREQSRRRPRKMEEAG
jgi:putative sigma-54 modulation protein